MSFNSENQERIPRLQINESLEFSSVTDSGSCETIPIDKLDAYISHRVNEILQIQRRSIISPQSQISELLNSYFLSSESQLKEAQNSISLKNIEIENLKNENQKLSNIIHTLESEIFKFKQENLAIPMITNELSRLMKDEIIKKDQLKKEIVKNEKISKELKLKDEELNEFKQRLKLVYEENKKLREVKDQMLVYYKKKIVNLKAKWIEAGERTKEIAEKMNETFEKRKVEKNEEVKSRRMERSFGDEKNIDLAKMTFKSMELERRCSSDKEVTPRKVCEKSKISNVKVFESPYGIKDMRRNKSQTKDGQEPPSNKSKFCDSPHRLIHRYQT